MKILTIGFTKKSAQRFFEMLTNADANRVIDVRLNNVSQLSGFAKKNDLAYFLREICSIDYLHEPLLAPTKEMLDGYKKKSGKLSWDDYERAFLDLIHERRIEEKLDRNTMRNACLLCSEDKPHHCHRRLVAEYLREHWADVKIEHL